MTQPRNPNRLPFSLPSQRVLLLSGLGLGLSWVSGLNVLSSGIAFAQTATAEPGVVPSAEELLSTPAAAPEPPAAPEVPQPQTAQPEAPVAPAAISESRSQAIEPVAPSQPLSQTPAAAPPVTLHNDPYIDTTDYSIGATRSRDQPSSVVLSERSSGCRIVLQQGQSVPNSVCAARPAPVASLPNRPTGNYSTVPASVSVGSVRVGGFSVGSTTPSGRDYYNRTMRPFGRLGNGNISPLFPLSIPAAITSVFGWRIHPITGDQRFHSGTDLGAAMGTPVLAAYAGQVAVADFMQGYGLTVVLQHNLQQRSANQQQAIASQQISEQTLYGHMSELFVQPGEWVQQGQVIGRVGSTGNSTGPHLHFEFRELTPQGWQALDPGQMLEYSLAQLVRSIQTAQANPEPFPKQSGFSRAIVAREAVAERPGK